MMSKMLYLTLAIIYISVQTSGKSVSRRDSSRGGFAGGLFQQEIAHLQRKIATQGQRIQLLENDNTGCKSQLNVLEWKLQNIDKKVAALEQKHHQDIADINANCQCSSNQPGHGINQPGHSINQPGHGINQPGHGLNQPGHGLNQPGHGLNQPGYAVNQPGQGLNQPGHGLNQPGHGPNQPGHSINQPGHGLNQPGYAVNQPGPSPNQPGYGSLPGYAATTEPGISGSLDYLHIEEEVSDSSSGWTQLVNGSYNYIRESQQSPASPTTTSPVLDSGNASGQWVWSDTANKWEWKLFPRQMLKSLPDIPVLSQNNGDLQQQQRQLQQQSQSQHQEQQQHQIQLQQHQQQQQNQQQQQQQQQHQNQHQQQHQQQGQNQQQEPDIDLSSMIGDSDCCWYQLPNSTWVRKSSSWFRTGSGRVRVPGNGAVHVPGNGAVHVPGNGAVDGAKLPVGSGSTDTGWKKLPNGSYMRKWSSWSSWSGGKPCC